MLVKIAWRNLWRNKRRSIVVLSSVIIGVIALIFNDGLMNGMIYQMLFNQISSKISHVQVHKKGFQDNKVVQNYIPDYHHVDNILKGDKSIKAYSKRVVSFGLVSSASSSSGIYVNGIDPEEEKRVSIINNSISQGSFLRGNDREILLGEKLAEKLNVGIGDKIVLMSNTPDGSIGSDVYRVSGLFKTFSSDFDKSNIYVNIKSAQKLLDIGDKIHEFAIILNNYKNADAVANNISTELNKQYEVLSYNDILPLMVYQIDLYKESSYIITLIVGLALIFGIINTMLMSVYERINEFGVLMSIGMKNLKLFTMIIVEAFSLGVLGTIIGLGGGLLLHLLVSHTGIDFSMFAQSLDSFGLGAVIYPRLSIDNTINIIIAIPFIAVLGAFYPAIKAIRLEPVYALRYV